MFDLGKRSLSLSLFSIFILVYCALIVLFADFGVIDDHTITKTLARGEYINFFIHPQIGRFYPLDAMDLNLIYFIFGEANPKLFYLFSAFGALILIICLARALNLMLDSKKMAMLLIFALLITPAFPTAFLRLFVPEKFESVFFALFILFYVLFLKNPRASYFILSLVFANVALYYKEVAFILLGSFAFFHFVFRFKDSKLCQKALDLSLMASCALWILMYYVFVLAVKTSSGSYGDKPYNQIVLTLKNLMNYCLSEPFLFVGISLLLCWRIYKVAVKKEKINPFFDACLIAVFMHDLAYVVLRIYSFHYPLPAYIFALFPLGFYFKHYFSKFVTFIFVVCIAFYALNGFFAFIYQVNHYKSVPPNFQATLRFLDSYLNENPKTNIYLEGVNRASQTEVYASFAEYLELLKHGEFDLRSDTGIDNIYLGKERPDSKYSVYRSNAKIEKQSGDLVVFTPFSAFPLNQEFLDSKNYELLFESKFGFNLPFIGIKTAIKYLAPKDLQVAHNNLALPIHFSVYRVK